MARTLFGYPIIDKGLPQQGVTAESRTTRRVVYFRALMDLGTGGVAGIEPAGVGHAHTALAGGPLPRPGGHPGCPVGARLSAWGREVREPAAYLVRADLDTRADAVAASLHVAPEKIILMYDVTRLLAHATSALDVLIAGKQFGARILLDHIDLADPPARFLEMLPADILRVALGHMPWHWDEDRRAATLRSLLDFAGNLLMDVAVEGVDSDGQYRACKRLGVRYAQGGWRRDHLGIVPDPTVL